MKRRKTEGETIEYRFSRLMRRIGLKGPVNELPFAQPHDGLCRPSPALEELWRRLNRVSDGLPFQLLHHDLRSVLGKLVSGSGAVLPLITYALRVMRPALDVRPEDLQGLEQKAASALTLWHLAARVRDSALDARLLIGAFGWFLVDRMMQALEEEFARPLSNTERDTLLGHFGPALLAYDKVLKLSWERRDELKKIREAGAERARDAEEAAFEAWFRVLYKHRLATPTREDLIRAAKYHMKKHGPPQGPLADLPVIQQAPAGPRIIQ